MSETMTNTRVIQAADVTQPTVHSGTAAGMAKGVASPLELMHAGKGTPSSKGVLFSSKQNWVWGLKLVMQPAVPRPAKGPKLELTSVSPSSLGSSVLKKKKTKQGASLKNPQIKPIFMRSADQGSPGLPIPTIHGGLTGPRIASFISY